MASHFFHIGQFTPQKYYGHLSLTKWCKNKKGLFCLLRDNAMFGWDWLGHVRPEMINLCKRCVEESQLHGTSNTKVGEQSTHQLAARNHCWFTDRGQPGMCLALSGQKEIHQNKYHCCGIYMNLTNLRFAQEANLEVSVRSGGHSYTCTSIKVSCFIWSFTFTFLATSIVKVNYFM